MNCNICKVEMERELTVSIIPNLRCFEVVNKKFSVCSMKCLKEFMKDSGLKIDYFLGLPTVILE